MAYRYFKYLYAPPILLGGGMLLAALIATSYYSEWRLDTFMIESAMVLGVGPLLFTIFCILLGRKKVVKKVNKTHLEVNIQNRPRLIAFLLFSILLGLIGCLLRIKSYAAYFGAADLSGLLMAFRLDAVGDKSFQIPKYISIISTYTIILAYFTSYILCMITIYKKKYTIIKLLLICQIAIAALNGILIGTKGALLDVLVRFAIIYIVVLYAYYKSYILPKSFYRLIVLVGVIFVISFKGIGLLVGREYLEDKSNSDVIAEYCGAEIKNFDIYMHGKDGNCQVQIWGEETFRNLYGELGIKEVLPRNFQYVNGWSLGNVYTQFFSMYKDFGWIGIVFLSLFMSQISMYIYNKTLKFDTLGDAYRKWIIIYASIGFTIFMGFFSFRFSEYVFTMYFVKNIVCIFILDWTLKRFRIMKLS